MPSNGRGANNPQQQRLAQERKAKSAWDSAVQTMTTTLMRRCEIAGKVAVIADQRASSNQAVRPLSRWKTSIDCWRNDKKHPERTDKEVSTNPQSESGYELPLELPKNAELNTVFHLQWPEQLEGRVTTAVSPLSIYYAQIRLEEQGQKVMKHFERQLKGAQARRLENGAWLDSATRPTAGKLRSVDVMITRSKPRPGVVPAVTRNSAEDLTVEILWIEINDFMSDNGV